MLATVVPLLRRDGDIVPSDDEAVLLVAMSAATIDRRLAPEPAVLGLRGRSHTKLGTLLKSRIPVRTWADWDDNVPWFVEIDLVGHEGDDSNDGFCFTLTVSDIATGWTIDRSVKNKAAISVFERSSPSSPSSTSPFPPWASTETPQRVHQPPPLRVLQGEQDHLHPLTVGKQEDGGHLEGRTGPTCVSSLLPAL